MLSLFNVLLHAFFLLLPGAQAAEASGQTDLSSQLPAQASSHVLWRKKETFADEDRSKVKNFVDKLMANDDAPSLPSENGGGNETGQ